MVNKEKAPQESRFVYRHSGMLVASDFEIPEWSVFASPLGNARADILITLGKASSEPIPADAHGVYCEGCLTFAEAEAGRWSVDSGKSITVEPISFDRMTEARLYTLGSAWGALGYQRGWAMLHGSAVQIGGKAGLFAGAAGQGKSTLAAAFVQRGVKLLSDDLSRVDSNAETQPVELWPSAGRLKLWEDALQHLGWNERAIEPDHFRDRKFHVPLDFDWSADAPEELSAVFILNWGQQTKIERLRGAEAVTALVDGTMYRKEYLELMGKLGEQIVHCARMASKIPIYRLTRPKDFAHLDEVCELVAYHLNAH